MQKYYREQIGIHTDIKRHLLTITDTKTLKHTYRNYRHSQINTQTLIDTQRHSQTLKGHSYHTQKHSQKLTNNQIHSDTIID